MTSNTALKLQSAHCHRIEVMAFVTCRIAKARAISHGRCDIYGMTGMEGEAAGEW